VLVIDTSGSVGQDTLNKFLAEAQLVMDELKPERLHLLSVSHFVCEVVTLETGDAVPLSLRGGGGTLFQPAFDWLEQEGITPDCMVYLTDGLAGDRTEITAKDYPLLWVSTLLEPHYYPVGEVIMVDDF